MGTSNGALKREAKRRGIDQDEYARRRQIGQRHCVGCDTWFSEDEFAPYASRCHRCFNAYMREYMRNRYRAQKAVAL